VNAGEISLADEGASSAGGEECVYLTHMKYVPEYARRGTLVLAGIETEHPASRKATSNPRVTTGHIHR
jgi:hypothetical protein